MSNNKQTNQDKKQEKYILFIYLYIFIFTFIILLRFIYSIINYKTDPFGDWIYLLYDYFNTNNSEYMYYLFFAIIMITLPYLLLKYNKTSKWSDLSAIEKKAFILRKTMFYTGLAYMSSIGGHGNLTLLPILTVPFIYITFFTTY